MSKKNKNEFLGNEDEIAKISGKIIRLVYNNFLENKSYIESQIDEVFDEEYKRMMNEE